MKNRFLLKSRLSPGDIVMLTAAVRDLHRADLHEDLQISVDTTAQDLWQHNPYICRDVGEDAIVIDCQYPLIHQSNQRPFHFIHGYCRFLSDRLGIDIVPTEFRGDLYVSEEEQSWISQVEEVTGSEAPFWIVVAGGKFDYTIKWWSHNRFQEVINSFQGRIQFVQIGEANHQHPPLENVIDLRGRTDIRQLIRLVYHCQGILCPVTFAMHLAPAVPTKHGAPKSRPCVVVAGGREPVHWEAYPGHRFLHTQGALPCCETGGCWKARTAPLGDGDEKDRPENLCLRVESNGLPKCMDLIESTDVVRAIESYFRGGMIEYIDRSDAGFLRGKRHLDIPSSFKTETKAFRTTVLEVGGLRRSGLHPIMNWMLNHFEGRVSFVNQINQLSKDVLDKRESDRLPCIDEKLRLPVAPQSNQIDCLLLGFEDPEIKKFVDWKYSAEFRRRYPRRIRFLILRDPFNLFASRLKASRDRIEDGLPNLMGKHDLDGQPAFVKLWKSHAIAYLQNIESKQPFFKVSYNRWVADIDYRKEISSMMGRPFSDSARESVPINGKGSSFDRLEFNQNASNMKVLSRWRYFENDPEYKTFFEDSEIIELSREIFGLVGIEANLS